MSLAHKHTCYKKGGHTTERQQIKMQKMMSIVHFMDMIMTDEHF